MTPLSNPAVVIPAGIGPGGMPMGLQIVGPASRDAWLPDVAHAPEERFKGDEILGRPVPDLRRYCR